MKDEFDVICVGSGGGGLGAALTAAAHGARVLVIEKSAKIGGVLSYSDGQVWMGNNHLAAAAGLPDSAVETEQYLEFLSGGVADPEMRANFIARGPEAIRFFVDNGIDLRVIRKLPDYYHPEVVGAKAEGRYMDIAPFDEARLGDLKDAVGTSPHGNGWLTNQEFVDADGDEAVMAAGAQRHIERGERCTGAGLAAALVRACADHGVTFRAATSAIRLTTHDGRVTGVVISDADGVRALGARLGVVLATGGYDFNPQHVKIFESLDVLESMAPATTTGDHITMGAEIGADAVRVRPPRTAALNLGFHTPGEEHEGGPKFRLSLPGTPHSIIVNSRGERFTDDGLAHKVMSAITETDDDGNDLHWPAWMIVDQNFRDKFTLGAVEPGQDLPEGMATVADTLEELAEREGIDPAGLVRTVERWNRFSAAGVDEDFGRGTGSMTRAYSGPDSLSPLDRGPFVAIKLTRVSLNTPSAGLRIGTNAEVLDLTGARIPGLYAAGNAAALVDIGSHYQSGLGNSRGLTYGYLAARDMLGVDA